MKGILEEKSFQFSLQIIDLYKYITEEIKEFVISKQVLRSGTSIGANIAEAKFAQSKADFLSKMSISLKEANETRYWLRLLEASYMSENSIITPVMNACNDLLNMLVATCKTTKSI